MTTDPLATFIELLERTAPEIARRMRPAPEAKIAELAKVAPTMPPEYRRFLELAGGNRLGELAPFMSYEASDVDHAIASYAPKEPLFDEDDEFYTPNVLPDGFVFLCQRFHEGIPMYCYYLAPQTSDGPPDPEGRLRVVSGHIDKDGVTHDVAFWGTLEEFLIYWLFNIRFPVPRGQLAFHRNPDDECEAGEYFLQVMEDAEFRTVAGALPSDWFQLFEHADGTWVWLKRHPWKLQFHGQYDVFVRAPTDDRCTEVGTFIHHELDCE